MLKSFVLSTLKYITIFFDSIAEGRRLRTEMVLKMHGVTFDKDGNVVIRR